MSDLQSAPVRRLRLWLIAVVVFAAAVRLIGLNFDDRHFFHPDERRIAFAVEELSFSPLQLNPHFFAYGSFPLYVTRAVTGLLGVVDQRMGHYDNVILIGRAVSAVVGVLTVILLVFLGMRLYNPAVGLLAGFLLAAAPLHVQNSHYMTTDVFLTFLVTLALYGLVGIVQRGRTRDYVFSGIVIGLATATKFSALPLLAPLAVACLLRVAHGDPFIAVFLRGLLAVLWIGLAFAAGQPYAFLDFANYYRDIDEQSHMVREAGRLPYTNQYIGVSKYGYDLEQLVLWGMTPPLGLVAIWATASRVVATVRERWAADLVLLAWVVPFFLITGWFDVKFVRYLLPIYPVMILWAAAFLWRIAQRSRLGRIALWTVVGATGLSALALVSVYTRPHTVVTASEWTYRHIPAGKTILTQHWDEGFPLPLPGGSPGKYKVIDLPYYEPDTPGKWRQISQQVAGADYIAFQTKRLYGALTMAPEKYPISNKYFYLLFAGDLGYTPIYEHASRPGLFGLEFPDELADESITVYDHPKVLIFENTGHLPADEIYQRIMQGMPSRKLTRTDLLLAGVDTATAPAPPAAQPMRSSVAALLWFALVVQLLGMSAFVILRRWLPVPGVYALAKVVGVLVFAWVPWLLTSLGESAFTRGTLAVTFVVMLVCGAVAWRRGRDDPAGRAEWWPTELLFWGVFLLFLAVRAFNPEVFWGEKPMDFAFLNALTRATTLPPPEPWFSGSTLHYTYFGHYIVAALGKLCHIHPGLTFNLGIALFAALTAIGAFALGCAIAGRRSVGVLAAAFVILIGNLAGLREVIARRVVNFDYFWATSRVIKDTINEYPFWSFLFADLHAHVLVMPFSLSFLALAVWWVRREEAPAPVRSSVLFLLLGFLLGAIMVTNGWSSPTYVLFLPFLLGCVQWSRGGLGRGRIVALVLLALLAGGVVALRVFLPGWPLTLVERFGAAAADLYFYLLLGIAAVALLVALPSAVLLTAAVVGVAYLVFLPFWSDFEAPPRNFGLEDQSFANFWDFANIFGLFLFIAIPFLFALWRRALQAPARERIGAVRRLAVWTVGAAIFACWILSIPAVAGLLPHGLGIQGSLRIGLAALAVLAFSIALQRPLTSSQRVATIMLSFAFAVTAGTDIVYVWDRMNTIFKFYLEAWFLFSAACAAAVIDLWQGLIRSPLLRRGWKLGLTALVALALFTAGSGVWAVANTRRVQTPRPTLDGTAYLAEHSPHDRAAYEWLNENIAGIPVIAEAQGPSYQEFSRVAMNTGLPTVLGWDYHVHQRAQRWPDINKRKEDLKKLYTSDNQQVVAEILRKYHVALVYVGPLERRTYQGANLERFNEWTDVLQPVYSNAGATIFAVQGQFAGAIPVNTIEEVPRVQEEEVVVQGAPGQLSQPRGVAVDADGNIYVADFGNDRVQKFDPQLQFLKAWGERGDLPNQFKQPGAIAVGPDGLVYVADTWNQRVQVFTADGEYKREWSDKYYGPRGIAAAPSGAIYLSDTGNHRVRKFTPDGVEQTSWGGLGKEPGQFTEPVGIAVDHDGSVYVVDNGNARIQIFDPDGKLLGSFPVEGWEQKVFSEPHVTLAPDGTIWVSVPVPRVIRAYDRTGTLLREIKGGDDVSLPFDRPMGLAYDARTDELVVVDLENRIVRVAAN
jgi:YYY domain-containing protein